MELGAIQSDVPDKIAVFGQYFSKDYGFAAVIEDEAIEGCSESNVCIAAGSLSVQTGTRQKR